MCAWVSVCEQAHMHMGAHRGQNRVSDHLAGVIVWLWAYMMWELISGPLQEL